MRVTPLSHEEQIGELFRSAAILFEDKLHKMLPGFASGVESPIERLFAAVLLARRMLGEPGLEIYCIEETPEQDLKEGLHVFMQAKVDQYRIDFLAINVAPDGSRSHTVIELDGHDFHERTKKQASYDKARDRHFTKKGWRVIRYTGSDVWAEAGRCAAEALEIARGAK